MGASTIIDVFMSIRSNIKVVEGLPLEGPSIVFTRARLLSHCLKTVLEFPASGRSAVPTGGPRRS